MGQVIRRLVLVVVVLAAVLVGVDLAARAVTESALASRVRTATHARSASATIDSVPFLWDAGVEGRLQDVTVVDRGVPAGPLTLDSVEVRARRISFDRRLLFNAHSVRLTSISSATVTVVTHLSGLEQAVAGAVGSVVTVGPGDELDVSVAGHTLLRYRLDRIALIPDCPLHVTGSAGAYTLSCTVAPVPAPVLAALSQS